MIFFINNVLKVTFIDRGPSTGLNDEGDHKIAARRRRGTAQVLNIPCFPVANRHAAAWCIPGTDKVYTNWLH